MRLCRAGARARHLHPLGVMWRTDIWSSGGHPAQGAVAAQTWPQPRCESAACWMESPQARQAPRVRTPLGVMTPPSGRRQDHCPLARWWGGSGGWRWPLSLSPDSHPVQRSCCLPGAAQSPLGHRNQRVQRDTSLEHPLFLPVPVDTGEPWTFLLSPCPPTDGGRVHGAQQTCSGSQQGPGPPAHPPPAPQAMTPARKPRAVRGQYLHGRAQDCS